MDRYKELALVGKGSYGKVYKVENTHEHEIFVLKKMPFDGTPECEAEAAIREGQLLSLLRHPHVVPYKEFFKANDGDVCLVMAYCEGGDLFKHIRDLRDKGKTVPEAQVWQWLVQLLLSLSYIHTKRILHRDVKTQNIFLSGGKVLLGDFGLAKQLQKTFEMARTPIGTPYYMAPEIYEEQPYSFKSDVWALGCVMYEMMTGKPAFAADNLSRVVIRVIRGQYDPISATAYTEPLRAVVTSMLCRDVKTRPDANLLLTNAAVVPHVQRYLESLTAEGPSGWATWRMKLPMAAMLQMGAALEAAAALRRVSGGGGRSRNSHNGTLQPAIPEEKSLEAPEPTAPAPAPAPVPAPATPEPSGPIRLPPLPPGANKLPPPPRTPYGLATPFMAMGQGNQQYAELQVLAHQMMEIRNSKHAPLHAPHQNAQHRPDGQGGAAAAGAGPAEELPAEVKELDRTLLQTLEIAHNAAAASAVTADDPKPEGGGIDEAWLSDHLPKSHFGFGSPAKPAPAPAAPTPASQPTTPAAAAPPRADHYHEVDDGCDDGFLSIHEISLHADSLHHRRENMQTVVAELVGDGNYDKVKAVVVEAQKLIRSANGPDGLAKADKVMRSKIEALLGGNKAKVDEVMPLIEEMALLH